MPIPAIAALEALNIFRSSTRAASLVAGVNLVPRVTWVGLRPYQKRLREADKKIRKEQRKLLGRAANVVRRNVRRGILQQFPTSKRLAKSVRRRIRIGRYDSYASIYLKGKQSAYGAVLDKGGTVHRRATNVKRKNARFRRKAHSATYTAKPFFRAAVDRSAPEVFRILGRVFKVV